MKKSALSLSVSKRGTKDIRRTFTLSSGVLAGMMAIGSFTSPAAAQEEMLNQEELRSLYEKYTQLEITAEEVPASSEQEPTGTTYNKADNSEEIQYIKDQLIRMVEKAGGESVLDQLNSEKLSVEQLDSIFNALIESQLQSVTALDEQSEIASSSDHEEVSLDEPSLEPVLEAISDEQYSADSQLTTEKGKMMSADEEFDDLTEVSDHQETVDMSLKEEEQGTEAAAEKVPEAEEQPTEDIKNNESPDEESKVDKLDETDVNEPTELTEEKETVETVPTEQENSEKEDQAAKPDPTPAPEPKPEPKPEPAKSETEKAIVHVVRSGDNLNRIAQTYNTTVARIASLNNIQNVNRISVGQVLAINEAGVQQAKNSTPTTPGNLHQSNSPAAFIDQISVHAQKIASENGLYASVMIAQAALESGYGRSSLSAPPNHNLFGIKGNYNGQSVAKQTREYYAHTGWITIVDHFKKYPNYEASLRDNARLLRNGTSWNPRFYSGTWVENTKSYRDASAWLQGRYATDPTYASKLNNLIQLYNLTRFDGKPGGVVAPAPAPAPVPAPKPTNPYTETSTYTVVRGDTLTRIAREFGTTVSALRAANNLSGDLIFVNQQLTVPKLQNTQPAQPKPETPAVDEGKESADSGSNNGSSGNKEEAEQKESKEPKEDATDTSHTQTYTVVRGDTLTGIARRFGTSVSSLRDLNKLTGDRILIGQRLTVPGTADSQQPSQPVIDGSNQSHSDNKPSVQSVSVKNGDTLSQLALTHKTTVAQLMTANRLQSDRIYVGQVLVIPGTLAEKPAETERVEETGTQAYRVIAGDTLTRIAREFNTTVSRLMQLNNLSSDRIREGAQLIVPRSGAPVSSPGENTNGAPIQSNSYTVKSGDTLSRIAREHGTTVTSLLSLNNLSSDRIFIGQSLKVSGTATTPEASKPAEKPATPEVKEIVYTVKAGDTLSGIAREHGTTVTSLLSLNNLRSDRIFIGQSLKVSGTATMPEASKPAEKPATPEVKETVYTVKAGDTLSGIARSLKVTISELKEWNQLSSDIIFVNQTLKVQKSEEKSAEAAVESNRYTVQAGDTLSHIARRFSTTTRELMALNTLSTDLIFVNQQLKLPQ